MMELGDIEKFFNENFFKKIPQSNAGQQIQRGKTDDFMHGVPESAYEPLLPKEEAKLVS